MSKHVAVIESRKPRSARTPQQLNEAVEQLARDFVNRWIEAGFMTADMRDYAAVQVKSVQ